MSNRFHQESKHLATLRAARHLLGEIADRVCANGQVHLLPKNFDAVFDEVDAAAAAIDAPIHNAPGPRGFYSAKEIIAKLRISRSTLYRLIASQGFPRPAKIGGSSRWVGEQVEQWLMVR